MSSDVGRVGDRCYAGLMSGQGEIDVKRRRGSVGQTLNVTLYLQKCH